MNQRKTLQIVIGTLIVAIFGATTILIPYIIKQRQIAQEGITPTDAQPSFAQQTQQNATTSCNTENLPTAIIGTSFTNTETDPTKSFNVTATDIQSNQSVELGAVIPDKSVTGIIQTNLANVNDGQVRFTLTWTTSDNTSDSETKFASYQAINCASSDSVLENIIPAWVDNNWGFSTSNAQITTDGKLKIIIEAENRTSQSITVPTLSINIAELNLQHTFPSFDVPAVASGESRAMVLKTQTFTNVNLTNHPFEYSPEARISMCIQGNPQCKEGTIKLVDKRDQTGRQLTTETRFSLCQGRVTFENDPNYTISISFNGQPYTKITEGHADVGETVTFNLTPWGFVSGQGQGGTIKVVGAFPNILPLEETHDIPANLLECLTVTSTPSPSVPPQTPTPTTPPSNCQLTIQPKQTPSGTPTPTGSASPTPTPTGQPTPTPTTSPQCNRPCLTDAQCQALHPDYTCNSQTLTCRHKNYPQREDCSAPPLACNKPCNSDNECKTENTNFICHNIGNSKVCRHQSDPGNNDCQISPSHTPTPTPPAGSKSSPSPTPLIPAGETQLPQVGSPLPTFVITAVGFFILTGALLLFL